MSSLQYSESIVVARSPEALYDMVSNVAQIANRTEAAHQGIPVTLAAIKKAAEAD
jgi:hypothetical protein